MFGIIPKMGYIIQARDIIRRIRDVFREVCFLGIFVGRGMEPTLMKSLSLQSGGL